MRSTIVEPTPSANGANGGYHWTVTPLLHTRSPLLSVKIYRYLSFCNAVTCRCGCRFLVRVSYLEIYNEEVRDLLGKDQTSHLEVKERPDTGVYVKDLSAFVVNNADDMDRIMNVGNKNRKSGSLIR